MAVKGPVVELRGVSVEIDGAVILRDVSMRAPPGEITVVLGPSGSGKTTLLRVIAGLVEHSGRVFVDGVDYTREPPWRRGVAMVFQQPVVYPHMSVYDNIALPLIVRRVPRGVVEERVRWAAEVTGITRLLHRMPRGLSGGEQQRVAIARALVTRPRVLLMDEPFSNLDLYLRERLRRLVARLRDELGVTIIHVTHDVDEALEIADHMVVLYNGRVLEEGDPLSVYERPRRRETAVFFNHNIVPVHRDPGGGDVLYPWSRGYSGAPLVGEAFIPPSALRLLPGDCCVVEGLLYRRSYALARLVCSGVEIHVAVDVYEARRIGVGAKKCVGLKTAPRISS